VHQWLTKANEDLAAARQLLRHEKPVASAIGFHAQQTAEKHLKAILTWYQIDFPKTHDIDQLLDLLAVVNPGLASALREASLLTPYGVEQRYPSPAPPLSVAQAEQALALAEKVAQSVTRTLAGVDAPLFADQDES
jgi:HEPN domain-containing protein